MIYWVHKVIENIAYENKEQKCQGEGGRGEGPTFDYQNNQMIQAQPLGAHGAGNRFWSCVLMYSGSGNKALAAEGFLLAFYRIVSEIEDCSWPGYLSLGT